MVSETFPPLAENLTDFNDLAVSAGLDAVHEQIEQAVPVGEPPTPPAAPAWPVPLLGGVAPPELQADALASMLGEFVGAL